MKKTLLLSIILSVLFLSCSENDDDLAIASEEGSWSLVKVHNTMIGMEEDIEEGIIIWTFNIADETVTVENNDVSEEIIMNILDAGVYPYVKHTSPEALEECTETITVNNLNMGCISFNGNTMIITSEYVDGPRLTFIK